MTFDSPVKIAFIISVLLHSFLIFTSPALTRFLPKPPAKNFEVAYCRIKEYKSPPVKVRQPVKNAPARPVEAKKTPIEKEKLLVAAQKKIEEAKAARKKEAEEEVKSKDIVIPPLPKGVEKAPAYMDYVQSVREKIKRTANTRFRRQNSIGDVLLFFVLLSDGSLSAAKVSEERSCDDEQLRSISRQIIQSAAPFDAFPKDLEYKQLSFSVVISFE